MDEFRLPDLGEGLMQAEIVCWHVAPGDHVTEGQPLVSVETDKAVVEIPAPRSGSIGVLHGAVGDIVDVGALLLTFGAMKTGTSGAVAGVLPEAPARVKASPKARRRARELGIDIDQIRAAGGVEQVNLQVPWALLNDVFASTVVRRDGEESETVLVAVSSAQPTAFST